jgi:hypothetical protein
MAGSLEVHERVTTLRISLLPPTSRGEVCWSIDARLDCQGTWMLEHLQSYWTVDEEWSCDATRIRRYPNLDDATAEARERLAELADEPLWHGHSIDEVRMLDAGVEIPAHPLVEADATWPRFDELDDVDEGVWL